MTDIKFPSTDPAHKWALFKNEFRMSTMVPSTSDRGIRWQLSDVKSVEMHVSGLWMIVQLDDSTTSWIRIGDDVHTIEFDRHHEAHLKPELADRDGS
jgi:hypothetical protein